MAQLISNRYASALFELALESNNIDKYFQDVELVYSCIKDDKEFLAVLNHPQISGNDKFDILAKTFKGKVSDDIIGLFDVVLRKNRETVLPEILKEFIEKVREHKGIVTAVVSSAIKLSDKQLEQIKNRLSENLSKQVEIVTTVDPQLIGGVKINVCGHLIDNTIKKQLSDLRAQLENTRFAQ